MMQRRKQCLAGVVCVVVWTVCVAGASTVQAQGAVLRKPAQEVLEALSRFLTRTGGRELSQELAELGGEAVVGRIAQRVLREGGDDGLNALLRVIRANGPDALRAVDQAVDIPRLLRAVDELPAELALPAFRRLAAGAEGRVLAEAVERYGSAALRAELRHPGIGTTLVTNLGSDGATLAMKTTRDQAFTLARHADDIAALPSSQRSGILQLLHNDLERVAAWMGEFTMKHPGKVLFTSATAGIVLAHSEEIFGGKGDIHIGPDGTPTFVPQPGMLERMANDVGEGIQETIQQPVNFALYAVIFLLVITGMMWLMRSLSRTWYQIQTDKLRYKSAVAQLQQQSTQPISLPTDEGRNAPA